jgi:Domain of unknown function (DUF1835)/Protein of unknown function
MWIKWKQPVGKILDSPRTRSRGAKIRLISDKSVGLMIHIVFQRNDIDVLKQAIELDPGLQGEIIQIEDDFAVGPLLDIYNPDGIENRRQWWRTILAGGDYDGKVDDGSVKQDQQTVIALQKRMEEDPAENIWIWAAQNKHDVSGYYWLIGQLKNLAGRIYILYLNNLPFINGKGHIFYPVNLFDIPAREFLKAKKLARPVTLSEFELDTDEWSKLCLEDKGVRILEGGKKLVQYDADFYDKELLGFISQDWQKASRVIHQFLSKAKQITGDAFLLWRLKQIVGTGQAEVQGALKNMKDFEIKSKTAQPVADAVSS